MVKMLVLSDIYGETKIINELVGMFNRKFDVCVIAGGINKPKGDKSKKIFEKLLEISEKIIFVNGGTDRIDTKEDDIIHNLEEPSILNKNNLKIGFLGIGGVPDRSIRRKSEYPNTWKEGLWFNRLLRKMNTDYNKLKIEKPNFYFFVSHSPPYGIADYSRKVTLNELESEEGIEKSDIEEQRSSFNPLHLGSKVIKEFILKNKIQAHFFGHVHKEGGKIIKIKDKTFVNVSHLSALPYKLTGRKFGIVQINKENINIKFGSVVDSNLDLSDFLETYL